MEGEGWGHVPSVHGPLIFEWLGFQLPAAAVGFTEHEIIGLSFMDTKTQSHAPVSWRARCLWVAAGRSGPQAAVQ